MMHYLALPLRSRLQVLRPLGAAAMLAIAASGLACGPAGGPAPGTGGIMVTVLNGVTNAPFTGASVEIQGIMLTAVTDGSGVALFTDVLPGNQTVVVRVIGYCATTRIVPVQLGVTTLVTMWMCSDVVEASNAPSSNVIALMNVRLATGVGTACTFDRLRRGMGGASIGDNALDLAPDCYGKVALLSPDHALTYVNTASAFPWSAGLGDVMRVDLHPKPLFVPVAFIIVGWTAVIESVVTSTQLANANALLQDSFAGIELTGDESGGTIPSIKKTTSVQATTIGKGCSNVDAIRADPALYQQGRVNVYVVPAVIATSGGGAAGESCFGSDAPEIIFLDVGHSNPFTFAHEVGHSLGLVRPQWGHTKGMKGFRELAPDEPLNVMAGTEALSPRYFSVGQVARMHMAVESWANRVSGSASSTLRSRELAGTLVVAPCGCPETDRQQDCPALVTDVARPGNVSASSGDIYACDVSVPATVNVVCPAKKTVPLELLPVNAVANVQWISLTPSIVTAKLSNVTQRAGVLTGHAPGTGTVRAFADGSFRTVTVNVSGVCPP